MHRCKGDGRPTTTSPPKIQHYKTNSIKVMPKGFQMKWFECRLHDEFHFIRTFFIRARLPASQPCFALLCLALSCRACYPIRSCQLICSSYFSWNFVIQRVFQDFIHENGILMEHTSSNLRCTHTLLMCSHS